jgi:hypothetical protein
VKDITHPRLLLAKAILFVVLGILAAAELFALHPDLATLVLLAVAIWAFARAYYFAFYVLEKYVDRSFRFSGLWAAARYLLTTGRADSPR